VAPQEPELLRLAANTFAGDLERVTEVHCAGARPGPWSSASWARILGLKTANLVLICAGLVHFRVPLPGSQPFSW
jgi:hypothetical protein